MRDLQLLLFPDPRLHRVVQRIPDVAEAALLGRRLLDAMYGWHGLGLADPQTGGDTRLFVTNTTGDAGRVDAERIFLDPRIEHQSRRRRVARESCLSLPGVDAVVERPHSVLLSWVDVACGERVRATYAGLLGQVVQHEMDHLDGRLFVDHLASEEYEEVWPQLQALAAAHRHRPAGEGNPS